MSKNIEKQTNYIEYISSEFVKELKSVNKELKENEFLFSSESRARFKRLRVELIKELVKLEGVIYGR